MAGDGLAGRRAGAGGVWGWGAGHGGSGRGRGAGEWGRLDGGGIASGGRMSSWPSPRCRDRADAGKMVDDLATCYGNLRLRAAVVRRPGAMLAM